MNSKQKGKRGELELAHLLQTYGYPAERGVQYSGLKGNADVVGVDGLHIECKRSEQVRDDVFLQQAENDARKGQVPIVMYRRNGEEWKALLRLNIFMAIWDELTDKQKATIKDKVTLIRRVDK